MAAKPDLAVSLAGLKLKNPVLVASGTFGFGREYADFFPLAELGGVVTKGLTLEPRPGNPPPRLAETPAGILNAIGLQNPGVDHFLRVDLPWLAQQGTTIIANIAGRTVEEYGEMAARLSTPEAAAVAALEVNISCPNVREGGIAFGTDPRMAAAVIAAVRARTAKPVIAKLSPNVTDIVAMAAAVVEAGADILSLINTLTGMAIDIETRRPRLANGVGGLSGPAIKPVAVRMVYQVARQVKAPIIGMGGITTAADALEFILAGAAAVAVGTANFRQPRAALAVRDGIAAYLERHGIGNIGEIVGKVEETA